MLSMAIKPKRSLILGLQRYTFHQNFKIFFQKIISRQFSGVSKLQSPNKNAFGALLIEL
jgi:hypothetical protein